MMAVEGVPLGRALDLDEGAEIVHDDVAIDLGLTILLVIEIEEHLPAVDPDRDRGHGSVQRIADETPRDARIAKGVVESDVGAGNRRRARSAVRPKNVAVDEERGLAQSLEVEDRAQRPAEETLDFLAASVRPSAPRVALASLPTGVRKHGVFRREPAPSVSAEKRRDARFETDGAIDLRAAQSDEGRAGRLGIHPAFEAKRTKLVAASPVPPGPSGRRFRPRRNHVGGGLRRRSRGHERGP
jgi:hypothetical protein